MYIVQTTNEQHNPANRMRIASTLGIQANYET